ncbi:MAG: restriction endonuclease subunit S [Bacteroidaceae bacterium]|nr:restriction endonuclease subunit S [Bacteroidaceae bacterium]
MSEWKKYKLKDICEIKSGKRLPKGSDFSSIPTEYKYIRARDIKNGIINDDELVYISEEVKQKISKYIVNTNDIVITIAGSIGDVAFVTSQFDGVNLTENAVRLTNFNNHINSHYIFYILNSPEYNMLMQRIAGGAAQPKMGIYKVEAIEITIPSLQRQNQVVVILSRYDTLIENYQKQIKLLEEAAQRLYKEWFVDLHFPGHENTKIVDGVPEGWEKKAAQEFFVMSIGKTPPRAEKEWFTTCSTDVPWVSISDMKDVMFVNTTSEYLTKEACEKFNVKVVPEGTIILSFKLTVGRVSIADIPVCTNEAIAHFRKDGTNWREYTLLYLRDYHYDSLGNTSGISKAVNSTIIKNMPFLMPSKEVLNGFSDKVAPIFNNIKILSSQIRLLTEARDRLLPKLMSGEIAV